MAASTYGTPGKLYLTPTSVTGTTGTAIPGILEREIRLAMPLQVMKKRSGVGVNSGPRIRHGRRLAARLIIPLRQQDVTGLKLLFPHLTTDGLILRPTGGTAAAEFAKLPTFAIILRPLSTSEKYVYSPNWAIGDGSITMATFAHRLAQLDAVALELIATRPSNATGPAYEWAAAATIAAAFNLTENPA